MSTLPRRESSTREAIEVDVGDFSHDRIYPDLNPELVGEENLLTEDEYYSQMAANEVQYQREREAQDILEQNAFADGSYAFE